MPIRISMSQLLWVLVVTSNSLAGVKFVSTYKDPNVAPIDIHGQKVAAFVMTLRDEARIPAEEGLAKELTRRGVQGVPGYTLVPKELNKDLEAVRQLLAKAGVRGAVVLRVVGLASDARTSTNSEWYNDRFYPSFYGYYGWGWASPYNLPQATIDTLVTIETIVYAVDQDKRLWAGRCETKAPKKIENFFKDVVGAAGKELKKSGILKK